MLKRIIIILLIIIFTGSLSHSIAGVIRSSDGRYIDHEDGTITDTKTGLMWTKKDSHADLGKCLNWDASKSYVSKLTTGEYSNWRLPTVKEYMGIYEEKKKNKGLHFDSIFTVAEGTFYWSSETVGSEKARFVFFLNGVVFEYFHGSCYNKGVRAVRRWDVGSYIPAAALKKAELAVLAAAPKIKELGKLSEDQIFELMDLMGEAADNGLITPLALEINEAILNEELILRSAD
jgi:hypothetical protein